MRGHEKSDFYRSNRDYASLLQDEEARDEEEDEYDNYVGSGAGGKRALQEEDPVIQEYLERREKLKEIERQKLRRKVQGDSRGTGLNKQNNRAPEQKRPLPYNNYGSFFGPSEPVVARRIIEDDRAREVESVAARATKEPLEHRSPNGTSGVSKLASQSRATGTLEKAKPFNEAALKWQRLKEARDYSFLFTDEDPSTSRQEDAQPTNSKNPDKEKTKQLSPHVGKVGFTPKKGLAPLKSSSAAKVTKLNTTKQPNVIQEKQQSHSLDKVLKPPGKPSVLKLKPSSEMVSHSKKALSGSVQTLRVGAARSAAGMSNGRKTDTPGGQSKKTVTTGSGLNGVQSKKSGQVLPNRSGSTTSTGKSALGSKPHKSVPVSNIEKKTVVNRLGNQQHPSTGPSAKKQPVLVRQAAASQLDRRRPVQSVGLSKQVTKTPLKSVDTRRVQKRPIQSDSENSFLDDDDDEGRDVSSMIRKMFGYNPNKYRDIDNEDDRTMEADFRTIQMEERRSARIAREEDDRELALIEEEERAEMAKKEAKRRKLKQR